MCLRASKLCRWWRLQATSRARSALSAAPRPAAAPRRAAALRRAARQGAFGGRQRRLRSRGHPLRRHRIGDHRPLRQEEQRVAAADLLCLHRVPQIAQICQPWLARRHRGVAGARREVLRAQQMRDTLDGRIGGTGRERLGGYLGCQRQRRSLRRRGCRQWRAASSAASGAGAGSGAGTGSGGGSSGSAAAGVAATTSAANTAAPTMETVVASNANFTDAPSGFRGCVAFTGCICYGTEIVTPVTRRCPETSSGAHFAELVSPRPGSGVAMRYGH